jgi:hypothetical protein
VYSTVPTEGLFVLGQDVVALPGNYIRLFGQISANPVISKSLYILALYRCCVKCHWGI